MKAVMSRLAGFIFTRSRLIIGFVVIMNIIALLSLTRISLNTNITSFFSKDNEVYNQYLALTEKYDVSEAIAILVQDGQSLLSQDDLLTLYDLKVSVEDIPGVSQVQTYLPTEIPVGNGSLDVDPRFITYHHDELEDFTRYRYPPATEFLSDDETTGLVAVTLTYDADADAVVKALHAINDRYHDVTLSLAGNAVIANTLHSYLVRILLILPPAAIALVLLVFYSMLRSRRLTILSMLPAGIGALWTLGTIFWQGEAVNIVTAVSPVFVIVMGSADGLHYTTHLLEKMRLYTDPRKVTEETMRMVLKPIILTSLTTMAGFASLAWSGLVPIHQMGIYVPLGIGYAGFLSVFFLPAVLTRIDLQEEKPPEKSGVVAFFVNAYSHKGLVLLGVAVTIGVAAYNLPSLKVVSDPLLYFKSDSPIRQTFNTVEDEFGGALLVLGDLRADRGLDTLRDFDYAEDVLDMERDLERIPGVLTVESLFDVVQSAFTAASGDTDYPESPNGVTLILDRLDEEDIESWYTSDGLRLVARTSNLTSEDVARVENFAVQRPELRAITGTPMLYDELNRLTVNSQIRSLAMALILVFAMLVLFFRTWRGALIGLVPIMITIVVLMGALSILNYQLNMVTATLSAVTVGVGVDYAIHLISGIQYEESRGVARRDAVRAAVETVGRPVLASAYGLAIGLSVMFLSPLHIHTEVAAVMWVTMTVSSVGALTIIPLLYTRGR